MGYGPTIPKVDMKYEWTLKVKVLCAQRENNATASKKLVEVQKRKVAFAETPVALIKEVRSADGSIFIICWTTESEFMSKNNQMEKLLFGAMMPFCRPQGMQVSH